MIAALCVAGAASAGPDGRVRVIDADTIHVAGETVRLFGIDAPEFDQTCRRPDGGVWRCGAWARDEARRLFERRRASCAARERDRYGRIVATCTVAGQDMGAVLVSQGLARAYLRYSDRYAGIEKEAAVTGRGIFGSDMAAPEAHRAQGRTDTAAPQGGCVIKGNISDNGRIYHLPGQEHYDRTRIDTARGERWFCSEADAQTAGWRRARR
jgi:endonuclease YncB( thermonuclease family)